jgi:hypothetical protein
LHKGPPGEQERHYPRSPRKCKRYRHGRDRGLAWTLLKLKKGAPTLPVWLEPLELVQYFGTFGSTRSDQAVIPPARL